MSNTTKREVTKHIGKTLLTMAEFANEKQVHLQTVHRNVNNGKIKVTEVGKNKMTFIDWSKYQDYEFAESKKRY